MMAPGPYSFTLDQATTGFVIYVLPPGKSSTIRMPMTGAVCTDRPSKASTLRLETQGGETTVRSIQFGRLGMTFYYGSSKPGEHVVRQSDLKKEAGPSTF